MKKKVSFYLVIFILFLISCNTDKNRERGSSVNKLSGDWIIYKALVEPDSKEAWSSVAKVTSVSNLMINAISNKTIIHITRNGDIKLDRDSVQKLLGKCELSKKGKLLKIRFDKNIFGTLENFEQILNDIHIENVTKKIKEHIETRESIGIIDKNNSEELEISIPFVAGTVKLKLYNAKAFNNEKRRR